jgi:hypothetical protein
MNASENFTVLKLVVFIIDWKKTKVIGEVFDGAQVRFHYICKGLGTASSEVLDLLGIGATEKAVVLALEQDVMSPKLVKDVARRLGLHNPGAGIAFTIPLSAINKPLLSVFKQSVEKVMTKTSEESDNMNTNGHAEQGDNNERGEHGADKPVAEKPPYDLLVAVVNQGYSDELMTVARGAGAGGGTVISARGLMHKGPVKFFGISVQDEKEIIIILSTNEKRAPIMSAESKAFGLASKAEGVVFSVPVDSITGIELR